MTQKALVTILFLLSATRPALATSVLYEQIVDFEKPYASELRFLEIDLRAAVSSYRDFRNIALARMTGRDIKTDLTNVYSLLNQEYPYDTRSSLTNSDFLKTFSQALIARTRDCDTGVWILVDLIEAKYGSDYASKKIGIGYFANHVFLVTDLHESSESSQTEAFESTSGQFFPIKDYKKDLVGFGPFEGIRPLSTSVWKAHMQTSIAGGLENQTTALKLLKDSSNVLRLPKVYLATGFAALQAQNKEQAAAAFKLAMLLAPTHYTLHSRQTFVCPAGWEVK